MAEDAARGVRDAPGDERGADAGRDLAEQKPAAAEADAGDGDDATASRASRRTRGRVRWPLRAAATIALLLLALSWAYPYLSLRASNSALAESAGHDPAAALDDARRAARLDPLAVDPLLTQALVLQQLGRNDAALAVLEKAQRLQPADFEVYYAKGQLLLNVFGRKDAAAAALRHALALNPLDAASASGLSLALGH